jgi:hypothetical protein
MPACRDDHGGKRLRAGVPDENFLENLFSALGDTGFDPKSLVVELTESVLMKHAEAAATILQACARWGYGWRSTISARATPAWAICESFRSMPSKSTSRSSGRSARRRGHGDCDRGDRHGPEPQLRVIAEGVETLESWNFFRLIIVTRRKAIISAARSLPSSSRNC